MSIESTIDMLAADAEAFRGDTLDEKKMIRLREMKELAEEVRAANPRVEVPFLPWDTRSRCAGVHLRYPPASLLEDQKEISALSLLFSLADHVFMVIGEDGLLHLTFDVADIWKEFHYEYDKK